MKASSALRRFGRAALGAALVISLALPVAAQEAPPPDVAVVADAVLPELPPGFSTRTVGTVTFEHHALAGGIVDPLAASAEATWSRVARELGADPDGPVRVRVGRSPEEMAALAPLGAPPPEYAVGVCYPALGLVLLTLSAPETWERPDLPSVFVHELAHLATHRASGGRGVPRWLDEGIAIHVAGERSLERVRVLWEGTVGGRLIALDDLSASFPSRPASVSLAYAESADFVAWILRRSPDGPDKLRSLLGRIARGAEFEDAVRSTWTRGIGQLEVEWRSALSERYGMLPLLLGSGLAWGLVAVLVVLAWVRKRRDARVTLERWEREEALAARERAVAEIRRQDSMAARGWGETAPPVRDDGAIVGPPAPESAADAAPESDETGGDDDERAVPPSMPPPRRRDDDLPSIEWDGDRHTLH